MTTTFVSLFVIFVIALAAPLVAGVIPNKPIPEVVFLIFLGALLGPNMAGLFSLTPGVETVSELGVSFLFLIAGYEIDPHELTGGLGRTAAATWLVSLLAAFGLVVALYGGSLTELHDVALAIALSTTAYGTLAPILKERGLVDTPLGKAVQAHGVMGELLPVLAIAVLLSTRAKLEAVAVLAAFFAVAALVAVLPARARKVGNRVYAAIEGLREGNAQALLRMVVVILLALVACASVFDLDVALGAFAAGFVVRVIMPEGDHRLEHKVNALGFGFFIPAFFVVSGAGIDLAAVAADPLSLLLFVALLLLARGVPVLLSTFVSRDTRAFGFVQRINVALYATMALPLIVAVCSLATDGGFMTEQTSSTLITAGAVTVLLMPVLTALIRTASEQRPVEEARDLRLHPERREEIRAMYRELRTDARQRYRELHARDEGASEYGLHDVGTEADEVRRELDRRRRELLEEIISRHK